jgi:hypothetical protein
MFDLITGRKFLVALFVVAIGVGCVYFKGDIPQGLLNLLQLVFGAFVVGNGVEHVASAIVDKAAITSASSASAEPPSAPAPTQEDLGVVYQNLAHIQQQNAESQQAIANVQTTLMEIIKRVFPKS